ncbi:MAG: methylated-DNA--[protein]-cysteine S-methyltransferase [Candidatus Ratteibacteria bacterium]|nr:methylated-DNA--[protein]-cysteine S-methyltransferase [Candidatus Ratteibacteria bacterium]
MQNKIFYNVFDSGIGTIGIASSNLGIVCLDIGTKEREFLLKLKQKFPACKLTKSKDKNAAAIRELKSYLKGNLKTFKCKLDLEGPPKTRRAGTPFQIKVWEKTGQIPYGKMYSYKFIAKKVGNPKAVRAVGNAMANNPIPLFIPCHRVIKSDGKLGRYGPGEDIKRKLLKLEKAI